MSYLPSQLSPLHILITALEYYLIFAPKHLHSSLKTLPIPYTPLLLASPHYHYFRITLHTLPSLPLTPQSSPIPLHSPTPLITHPATHSSFITHPLPPLIHPPYRFVSYHVAILWRAPIAPWCSVTAPSVEDPSPIVLECTYLEGYQMPPLHTTIVVIICHDHMS